MQKAAQKAEAAEMKKIQKEKQKWENGKLALKSIVAEIDAKVVELGSVGGEASLFLFTCYLFKFQHHPKKRISCLTLGHLLTRLAEKGITFRIKSNPIERSILWTMNVPEHISEVISAFS